MSSKWASHGEKDEGFIPALQEKLTAAAGRTPSTVRRVSRVGEDTARDLELIPIDILLATQIVIMKTGL
jgi:hypothetical protein